MSWRGNPDPSPRAGAPGLLFSARCALNAIEAAARVLAGVPPHPRLTTNGKGDLIWRPQ